MDHADPKPPRDLRQDEIHQELDALFAQGRELQEKSSLVTSRVLGLATELGALRRPGA